MHLPDAILTQRDAAIANGPERNLCLLLSQADVNMLELSDGCLTSELLFSVNRLNADPSDVNIIAVIAVEGVYLVKLASGTVKQFNDFQIPFEIDKYSETDVVISDFESDVWYENADCSPIILAGEIRLPRVDRLSADTCYYVCPQTKLNEARTNLPNYGLFE